ncbi:MAG: hypothetical protein ACM3PY_16135 [Omnitrophica WOR_2 bacterium]
MDLPILLITGIVCILIGVFLDNAIHLLRNRKENDIEARLTGSLAPPAEKKPVTGPLRDPSLVGVAHLWRDELSHRLVVELGGKKFRLANDLNLEQRKQVDSIYQDFMTWIEPVHPKPVQEKPISISPDVTPQIIPTAPISAADTSYLDAPKKVSLNPLTAVVSAIQSDIKVPEKQKSLAAQIDEILQVKLRNTPMVSRGIRLTESPDKGVEVRVGMEKYDSVDAVPYEDVRQVIREAVDEWGKKAAGS